ncbi:3-deoxy-D-manno-octulosonic acid transferase [Fusobacterium perfoetens]|uniref:3-deoxy-D-manno-octulosonic acid transferase n=1 Tax=Fusobacterium perfoetens TaxID=852 RepID=UPI001F40C2E1|nr:glycosyltransferase N-terminal domain-containing protein [Fusobacterium perfoetens]MCF2611585.1 3-deoxy-D-manno-octulosonic acid transferase [Fusobacterium perfoetens]
MLYNFFRLVIYIPLVFVYIFNSKKREFLKRRFFQDFAFLKNEKEYIWIHCSSVGEVNLSDSLIKKILEKKSENILLSVFTDTGFETAEKKYSTNDRIKIIYFPLDDYFLIKTILKSIRLKTLIVIETEIWPNLINLCSKAGKVILANGRISDKSFKRDKKIGFILKSLLGEKIDFFCVQTEIDKERFIELGAKKNRVEVTGNLKFDIELENFSEESKENLKNQIYYNGKKIFVCGSTRTGEDEILIDSFKKLKNYLLVLVPRHLDRIPKLEELIKSQGLTYKKYSELEEGDYQVLIVDKMGILRKFYSIADVTFVGGTLVNIGGHSLLEPLFYRKTPIFGKYLQNVKDISKEVLKREIGYLAENSEEIYENILKIEKNDLDSKKIEDFFRENQNVAEKILEKI